MLGAAVLVGSITMDRLEQQNINPYTVPGLLPGLLGIAMMLLGAVLAVRSWRRGALARPRRRPRRTSARSAAGSGSSIALCIGYGVVPGRPWHPVLARRPRST